ncbi:MAG: hypothetical protein ACYCUM_14575, partial [Solirubrobacteraceae bacterium]
DDYQAAGRALARSGTRKACQHHPDPERHQHPHPSQNQASFNNPNSEGAIDSAKFDPTSPAFQKASAACTSQQPSGPVTAAPGAP